MKASLTITLRIGIRLLAEAERVKAETNSVDSGGTVSQISPIYGRLDFRAIP